MQLELQVLAAAVVPAAMWKQSGFNKLSAGRHGTRSGRCFVPRTFTARQGFLIDRMPFQNWTT